MTAAPRHNLDTTDPTDAALHRVLALRRLAERALVHGDAAEKALAAAILDCIDQGEGGLAAALGLGGPGWTGALRRYRQERRDAALRAQWRMLWPDLGPSAAARVLAAHWARYAASAWPRHKRAGTEPTDDPEATLHRLLAAGHAPLAAERLRKVLRENGQLPSVELTRQTAHHEGGRRRT